MLTYKDELKAKKRKRWFFRLYFFLVLTLALCFGLAYFLFFSKIFEVRSINIEAAENSQPSLNTFLNDWLDVGFWRFTRRNSILFVSANKLTTRLANQFPNLSSIAVKKDWPHAVIIEATERKPVGAWCLAGQTSQNAKCYHFDKEGVVFAETQPSSGFLITNVADYRSRELKLGEKVDSTIWFQNIIKVKEFLARIGVNVSGFIIPADSFDEFHAKTAKNWKIMFSNSTNIEKQVDALAIFLKEKLTLAQKSSLQYVDLRIQDRIYYK